MIVKAKITKAENEQLMQISKKTKLNIEICAGRAIKAYLKAQKLKKKLKLDISF